MLIATEEGSFLEITPWGECCEPAILVSIFHFSFDLSVVIILRSLKLCMPIDFYTSVCIDCMLCLLASSSCLPSSVNEILFKLLYVSVLPQKLSLYGGKSK